LGVDRQQLESNLMLKQTNNCEPSTNGANKEDALTAQFDAFQSATLDYVEKTAKALPVIAVINYEI
jgi:hypothetical protein